MAWARPSQRVAELMREGVTRALDRSDDLFARVDEASLTEHDPAVAEDPVLLAAFRRANRATLMHWAESNLRDPGGEVSPYVGPEPLALARDLVRRGLDAAAVEPYRAGQNASWQAWMEIAFELTSDVEELRELLEVSARSIFGFVDATIAAVYARISAERTDLMRGTNAERLETVTLVLDEAPIDVRRASLRLGYDFDRPHTGAIIWSDDPDVDERALRRAAEALARAAGAQRPLTVDASTAAMWAWVTGSRDPDARVLDEALEDLPDVRIALGSRSAGVEGFRRSHFDAFATQRLVVRLSSPLRVARYEELKVVSLVAQDERRARAFVEETLGDLVSASPTLRETLRTYLHAQSNATRAALILFTHRNTVVSRLARAEELLPRPLEESAFEVAVALEVLHWQGAPSADGARTARAG